MSGVKGQQKKCPDPCPPPQCQDPCKPVVVCCPEPKCPPHQVTKQVCCEPKCPPPQEHCKTVPQCHHEQDKKCVKK